MAGRKDYEERKQARIERYEERAEKTRTQSNQLYDESHKMISAIPMGQPLLVDHYSYNRDKNYRDRAFNKMGKSIEAAEKADYYESKAAAVESNNAIFSDDPDAIRKLKEKLMKMEENHAYWKKQNAYYRKHGTMKGFEGLSDEEAAKVDERIKNDYSWQRVPCPAYSLANNNAEIRRIKSRIKQLEAAEQMPDGEIPFNGGVIFINKEINRVQIKFDEIPDEETRSKLKGHGFHWSRYEKAWQRLLNKQALSWAKYLMNIE